MVNSQDELDKRILDTMLSGKGISPRLSDLARELSRPRSTIDLRVRLLEDEKIIEGYRPVINWKKLGFAIEGYVGVSCSDESVHSLLEAIKNCDCCSVESVFEVTTGMFDIFAKCRFKNYEEIKELRKRIHVMDGVKEVDVCLLGPCHKGNGNDTVIFHQRVCPVPEIPIFTPILPTSTGAIPSQMKASPAPRTKPNECMKASTIATDDPEGASAIGEIVVAKKKSNCIGRGRRLPFRRASISHHFPRLLQLKR